eukprot:scaffold462_cov195-Pinguiococcus_pyrenoidosus.AAC.13
MGCDRQTDGQNRKLGRPDLPGPLLGRIVFECSSNLRSHSIQDFGFLDDSVLWVCKAFDSVRLWAFLGRLEAVWSLFGPALRRASSRWACSRARVWTVERLRS